MKAAVKVVIAAAITWGLAACGGGGGDSSPAPITQTPAAVPDSTPPTVVSVTPANGVTGVSTGTTVSVNFSELISCSTVTSSSVTLASGGNAVAGTLTCSGSSATFTPTTSLGLSGTYTFGVTTAVKDVAGNALSSAFTATFLTAAAASSNQYTVNGTLAGLNSGRGVALQLNGGAPLSLTSNGPFTFAGLLNDGAAYNISVASQPFDQQCTLSNATGTIGAGNVSNMTVTCSNVIAPLNVITVTPANSATAIANNTSVSANFSDALDCASVSSSSVTLVATAATTPISGSVACSSNSVTFTPAASLALNASYTFNVATTVRSAAGAGLVSAFTSSFTTANTVVNNQYTVGGNLTGLANGRGVALQLNGANTLALTSPGTFLFANNLSTGAAYNVSVLTQPNEQTCAVSNGSGTLAASNIINVAITCSTNTYTINGSLTGLGAGKTVTLQNNGADDATFTGNGTLSFRTALPALSTYNVTVATQPIGQTCTVNNGNGVLGTSNVINIGINCVNNNYTVGGTLSGLGNGNTITLQNNGGDNLVVSSNGSFSFASSIATGGAYNVSVATQPSLQTCSISNGSGNVVGANVANVAISCSAVTLPSASTLSAAYGLKQLQFSWTTANNATYYKLMNTVDGVAPYTQVGSDLTATNVNVDIPVHLTDWVNARYRIDACNPNPGACTSSASIDVIGGVISTIGYVKASNTGPGDLFGFAVALSGDGNTLAVGAPKEDSVSIGIDGNQTDDNSTDQGAVYLYAKQNGSWVKQAYLKSPKAQTGLFFGYSLALSRDGNTLAVGAPQERSKAMGVDSFIDQSGPTEVGAVFTFVRTSSVWSYHRFIKDTLPDGLTRDQDAGLGKSLWFGASVGLSADGHTLVVGAPHSFTVDAGVRLGAQPSLGNASLQTANGNSGSAFVFSYGQSGWTQEAIFKANNNVSLQPMFFGVSVAISGNGDTVVVAAQNEQSAGTGAYGSQATGTHPGAAYVFQRTRSNSVVNWTQDAYFKGDADNGNTIVYGSSSPTNLFSSNRTVAISYDGNTLVAYPYVFGRDPVSAVWSKQSFLKDATAVAFNFAGIAVGSTVAMNAEGTLIAVGGPADFGNSTPHNLYARSSTSATTWTPLGNLSLVESRASAQNDSFGIGIAMSEDGKTLAIGAPTEDSNATLIGGDHINNAFTDSGAVYLY